MKDLAPLRRRAIALMREAIVMLDEAREHRAANHLQAAIDAAERVSPMKPGDTLPDDSIDTPESTPQLAADPALVRAIGGALAVFATLMARQGGAPVDEVARLLGIYAAVTKERSDDEGLLVACWGAILRDFAEAQRGGT
ncbi:hypothetical protein [Sphingobium yanoikuyae]|mgnify:FL=1|jgi:hypothetical protein|uniref:hypothetical protein n=1 Tax=Sphingobium yanoikuyae TaxID=13690 RepID=UPI001929CCCF|nr:hypothetical protein [Sphingobium yanoikuyae]NBB42305.1 hypothetical protein [Sphingobium yanoikuyae]